MNFTFPKDKGLHYGVLKKYIIKNNEPKFSLIEPLDPIDNLINIDGIDYYFTYLNLSGTNKGSNSIILKLYESQNIDLQNLNYGIPDLIIKILKSKKAKYRTKPEKRFLKEIVSLRKCKKYKFQNIIKIFHFGKCKIFNPFTNIYNSHYYYTMEYAPYDLKTYVESNHIEFNIETKLSLCLSIAEGIKELDSLDYYHRDIKPDNIFFTIDNIWKIGDLGLVIDRDDETEIDSEAEFIGPRGWISPEAMNKYLTEGKGFTTSFNCNIDHQSDIFQLGKIFWYIFQHNAPIGSIKEHDFLFKNRYIYCIIRTMLNYSKSKRYKRIEEVIYLMKREEKKILKNAIYM